MPANRHIVADLDLIVDFCSLTDHGVTQTAPVDRRSGADLNIVLDQNPSGLRHLHAPVTPKGDEAVAVLTDAAARMNHDIVANHRVLNRSPRADIAIPADGDAGANHSPRPYHRSAADLHVWANHGQRINDYPVFKKRSVVDDGG